MTTDAGLMAHGGVSMACKKCGSDWTTTAGGDCKSCPQCCKMKRCIARKQGLFVEPTQKKLCKECGIEFVATGLSQIKKRVLCGSDKCKKSNNKRRKDEAAKRRSAGIYVLPRGPKPKRQCAFSGCGNTLTRRDQGTYCSKPCFYAAVSAGEQKFKGRVRDEWASLVDWAYEWEGQRPEWVECEVCCKTIERKSINTRICGSGACSYRIAHPVHETCLDCGKDLQADTRHVRRCNPCNKKRQRAIANAWKKRNGKTPRQRCRRHGVPCDPSVKSRAVFERDQYKCQLCGRRCLRKFTVVDDMPDNRSPTVDHIIAIALGIKGHTWDNVQCACWECNVAKGCASVGQLRLALT